MASSYSQNREDIDFILPYFNGYIGSFAELGSNEGITLSNCRALYDIGWGGICVDASPLAFERLQNNYKGEEAVELYNLALGDFDGMVKFHESGELLGHGDIALVSSIKPEEVRRWDRLHIPFHEIEVPINTWDTLLKKSRYDKFDFISVDIEGNELCLLPQMDFKEMGTKMIIIEFNGKDQHLYNNIMLPQGFKLIHKNAENLIYTAI